MPPRISAVVSTRDRGALVRRTVESILGSDEPGLEIVVVDQSADDRTAFALGPVLADERVRYVRSPTIGLSHGRNMGVRLAQGQVVALTDDDCEVPGDWPGEMLATFARDERIGLVFGSVEPAPHDRLAGLVLACPQREVLLAGRLEHLRRAEGIGGCMGLRRGVWATVGGFDEGLGAGARFPAAEEVDLSIRAILRGYRVCYTPRVRVVHHGLRPWPQARGMVTGYARGNAAVLAKLLRCGHWEAGRLFWHRLVLSAAGRPLVDVGTRRYRWARSAAFARGLLAGLVTPVDRATLCYVAAPAA